MVRIVCSKARSGRMRVKVTAQHITVRHKPSEAFAKKIEDRKVSSEDKFKIKENQYVKSEESQVEEPASAERLYVRERTKQPARLPRLADYLDRNVGRTPQSEGYSDRQGRPGGTEEPSGMRRKARVRRQSAYAELLERLKQK